MYNPHEVNPNLYPMSVSPYSMHVNPALANISPYSMNTSPIPMSISPYSNQTPYHNPCHNPYHNPHQLKPVVLSMVEPIVQYGLKEAKVTSYPHAFTEVASIAYLMGCGYDPVTAHKIVESWEVNEVF